MSLLLDALKKAAQDKEKASRSGSEESKLEADLEESAIPDDIPEEMDLELDPVEYSEAENGAVEEAIGESDDTGEEITENSLPMDDLPEIREEIEARGITGSEEVDIVEISKQDDETIKPEPVMDSDPPDDKESSTDEPEKQGQSEQVTDEIAPVESPKPAVTSMNSVQQSAQSNLSARDALDAMINKTRAKEEKHKKLVMIAGFLLVLMLMVISGVFYYFQAQDEIARLKINQQIVMHERQPETPERIVEKKPVKTVQSRDVTESPVKHKQIPQTVISKPTHSTAVTSPAVAEKKLTIVKKRSEDPVEVLLNRAYELFNEGKYDQANDLYNKVLNREPDNRDALLGNAAVALKLQRREVARQKYNHLLRLDPKDSLARAGLASIESAPGDESRLKNMIREQPEASHLYFALGSVYANEQRWADAQQAFFSAWSGDNKNPDYAYNLAVSLDQLGKYRQARSFYELTLKLGGTHTADFSRDDIKARIKRLESLEHG